MCLHLRFRHLALSHIEPMLVRELQPWRSLSSWAVVFQSMFLKNSFLFCDFELFWVFRAQYSFAFRRVLRQAHSSLIYVHSTFLSLHSFVGFLQLDWVSRKVVWEREACWNILLPLTTTTMMIDDDNIYVCNCILLFRFSYQKYMAAYFYYFLTRTHS